MAGMPQPRTVVEVPLRWGDMDAYQHVNNATYLRYLEEGRIQAFQEWFGDVHGLLDEGIVVARTEIDYLVPLVYGREPARVVLWCSHVSGASFDLAYEIGRAGSEVVHVRAEVTMVTFDLRKQAPRRLTDGERAALEKVLGEPVPLRSRRRERRP